MKTKRLLIGGLLFGFVFAGVPANAAELDASTKADVQCLVAAMETAKQIDKLMPGASTTIAWYFIGRLDGRNPALDLESAIRAQAEIMGTKELGEADIRCGGELKTRGAAITALGEDLMKNSANKS